MNYKESWVDRDGHRIYTREYPGQEPAILLLHGFPDNLHLYDRLVPELAGRRVVVFDFLGWGASDKPTGHRYTAANQTGDLDAVISQLGLDQVTVVVHDASGPPGIDWALEHPDRVAGLVLLNTYYCNMPGLRSPEAIWLFSTPLVRAVARPASRLFGDLVFRRLYHWQVARFFGDPKVGQEFLPLLYQQFVASPSTHEAFFGLNRDLRSTIAAGTAAVRSGSSSAPPTPTSTPGWHGSSTRYSQRPSCRCWTAPATTCNSTNRDRSPGCSWRSRRADPVTAQATPVPARPAPPPEVRRILVTGASGGIGRATVLRLADAGHVVFAAARRADRLQALAATHSGIRPVVLDR
jgi:haloalkane dehalogenase